jgi:hypothetical protein
MSNSSSSRNFKIGLIIVTVAFGTGLWVGALVIYAEPESLYEDLCPAAKELLASSATTDLAVKSLFAELAGAMELPPEQREQFTDLVAEDPTQRYEGVIKLVRESGQAQWTCPALRKLLLHPKGIATDGVTVTLAEGLIRVQDRAVMLSSRKEAQLSKRLLPVLKKSIDAKGQREVLLVAEPDTPAVQVATVIRSLGRSGFRRCLLSDGKQVRLARPWLPKQNLKSYLGLTVKIAYDGFNVGMNVGLLVAKNGSMPTVRCTTSMRAGRCPLDGYSYKALKKTLRDLKRSNRRSHRAILLADHEIPYEVLLKSIAAARGTDDLSCSNPRACSFDEVIVGATEPTHLDSMPEELIPR